MLPGDFLSRSDLEAAVRGHEVVFHFLATTSPATAEADPTLDIRTNVIQTVELLSACAEAGVRHVYFASTGGAIYGEQERSSPTKITLRQRRSTRSSSTSIPEDEEIKQECSTPMETRRLARLAPAVGYKKSAS